MPTKSDLAMMEMFNRISESSLSPNQFYLLYSMREQISPVNINISLEIRLLENDGWIKKNPEAGSYDLEPKAHSIINMVESYFKVQKKKTSNQLLGGEFGDKILAYNGLFPRRKGGSGKYLRSNAKNVEANFRWFFQNYEYSWETILAATEKYVVQHELDNYKYIRTSMYFIRKQDSTKINSSDLADYCEMIISGEDTDGPGIFTENVV